MHHIIILYYVFDDINPFIPLQKCFQWHKYSRVKKEKKPKHLKLIYLWNYLTKMKEKIKSFDNEIIQKKLIK